MYQTGLVSISFRQHTVEEIIEAVKKCGLTAIEWGSDVHVPPQDEEKARYVRKQMDQNGLVTSSYGSYYYLGTEEEPGKAFVPYLRTAKLLGAPVIRIWCGRRGSQELTGQDVERLAREAGELADLAAAEGITISLECHNQTLTDDYETAAAFLRRVARDNLTMCWQPNQKYSFEWNRKSAEVLAPCTANIHVFSWEMEKEELIRYPLSYHEERWNSYLDIFAKAGKDHVLLLEFMHDDRIETLAETAETLKKWVNQQNQEA